MSQDCYCDHCWCRDCEKPANDCTCQEEKKPAKFDVLSFIMDFEGGEISDEKMIEGFQHLIDTGMAWSLQGSYGRTATALIEQGHCVPAGQADGP